MKEYLVVIIDRCGLGKTLEDTLNLYSKDGWALKAIISEENTAGSIDIIFEKDVILKKN
jgi:hypothetical protein